jgi:tetratricopeptide (TPR) repeat protein
MSQRVWLGWVVAIGVAGPSSPAAQETTWVRDKCALKGGHYLVESGILYLSKAPETKFPDQRAKYLRDANRVLTQALGTTGQEKNPAAWYYLGRYYAEMQDVPGVDTAFGKAAALAPKCVQDINLWRRKLWVPIVNAGVAAWQAGNTDSAIASFRRATQAYAGEPDAFAYLASLLGSADQPDSAVKYFKLAVTAAQDPKFAKQKKDAQFNVARVYHAAKRWDEAVPAYKEYLAAYPNDAQATAGLATVYFAQGKRDDAMAMYAQLLQHADVAEASDLFRAGAQILSVLTPPDTAVQGNQCRTEARSTNKSLTVRQIAARCDSTTRQAMRTFETGVRGGYRMVEQVYEAGLTKAPYDREALFTLAGVSVLAGDTAKGLTTAQRLYAVDPLNRGTLRMVAQAWQLRGKPDSTLRYLQIADTLSIEVTTGTFTPDSLGAAFSGVLTNVRPKANGAFVINFEFLGTKGDVVATEALNVTPIAPGENQPFALTVKGAGIVAWRYKRA